MVNIKTGDVVILKDLQTLLHLLPGDADVTNGVDAVVTAVTEIHVAPNVCDYTLIETNTALSLLIKRAGRFEDIRVMFAVDGVPSGDRQDWIDGGAQWLFLPPVQEMYSACDLEYTGEIWNGDLLYKEKHGSLYGSVEPAVVHEWTAGFVTEQCANPEIVVIETGRIFDRRGGFITFLQGAYVASSDIEFMSIENEE